MPFFTKPTPEMLRARMLRQAQLDLLEYEQQLDLYSVAVRTTKERLARLESQTEQAASKKALCNITPAIK